MKRTGRRTWIAGGWLALGLVALTGCGNATLQERLGMTRRAPDEFQVVRRQPLVLPPDYSLRQPGTPSPVQQQGTSSLRTQELLFGQRVTEDTASPVEQALLAEVPGTVEPNIRELILEENTELTQLDESRFLFILDFQQRRLRDAAGLDRPIDPVAEAARLEAEGLSARVVTQRVGTAVVGTEAALTEPPGNGTATAPEN